MVLLFWRTTCGFYGGITSEVAGLEAMTAALLVTGDEAAEVRGSGLTSTTIRDRDGALNAALHISGTPVVTTV